MLNIGATRAALRGAAEAVAAGADAHAGAAHELQALASDLRHLAAALAGLVAFGLLLLLAGAGGRCHCERAS